MPVQYKDGVLNSHHHTRKHASIFDVSHMLQFKLHGKDRVKCLESLVVADIEGLNEHQGMLSVFTNPEGGIRDDLIINKLPNELYVVSNAGCADKVKELIKVSIRKDDRNERRIRKEGWGKKRGWKGR